MTSVVGTPAPSSPPSRGSVAAGGKKKTPSRTAGPRLDSAAASREGKQLMAAILEVLAGARTPTAAAQALGMSLPRYYAMELRALHGMLEACQLRPLGRRRRAESELAALRRETEQLRRECARQQALLRAAQRTVGLAPATTVTKPDGKKRRRRPTARALKAAARLQEENPEPGGADAMVVENHHETA